MTVTRDDIIEKLHARDVLSNVFGDMTQFEMAKELGVTPASISQWKKGTRQMSKAVRTHIARIAGL